MAADKLSTPGFFEKHRDKIAIAGPDDCWLWTGGKSGDGYGRARTNGKTQGAHRLAYEVANGTSSASGFVVRHKCDVRACINPAHLELGTADDNLRDKMERGRQARPQGEAHGRAKLTEADILAIRALYVFGSRDHNLRALGRRFGITAQTVGLIVRHERWGHMTTPQTAHHQPLAAKRTKQVNALLSAEAVEKLDRLAVVYGSATKAVEALILNASV